MLEDELKVALRNNSALIGSRSVERALKTGNAESVIVSSNCPENVRKDIEQYTKLSKTKLQIFPGTGKQLGVACGKPFSIAALAIVSRKSK